MIVIIPYVQCFALFFFLAWHSAFCVCKQFVNLCHRWLSFLQTDVLWMIYTNPLSWKSRVFSSFAAANNAMCCFVHKAFSFLELLRIDPWKTTPGSKRIDFLMTLNPFPKGFYVVIFPPVHEAYFKEKCCLFFSPTLNSDACCMATLPEGHWHVSVKGSFVK